MSSIVVWSDVTPEETARMDQAFQKESERAGSMTKEERAQEQAAQRLSWAYGNQPLDADVTKEQVRENIDGDMPTSG